MNDDKAGKVRVRNSEMNTDTPVPTAEACPGCGKSLRFDAVICVECGFDKRKGIQRGTGIGAGKVSGGTTTCSGCGYSMVGLKSRKCPECGVENKPKSWKDYSKVENARVVRQAYMVPAIMLGAGLASMCLVLIGFNAAEAIPFWLAWLAVSTTLGAAAFFILCLTWIGFDAPVHLTMLRLAAIDSVMTAAWMLSLVTLPEFIVVTLALWAANLLLTAWLLDIEYIEAFVLGLIKFGLRIALMAVLVAILGRSEVADLLGIEWSK
ncbi:MAG: hypothetical protein K2X32_05475 [Phycisphaerales bacterium]|nr:hypothetical protein [Phycisphaerales bacterium]